MCLSISIKIGFPGLNAAVDLEAGYTQAIEFVTAVVLTSVKHKHLITSQGVLSDEKLIFRKCFAIPGVIQMGNLIIINVGPPDTENSSAILSPFSNSAPLQFQNQHAFIK